MVALRSLVAAFASTALVAPSVVAHSLKRSPLSYVSVVDRVRIHTPAGRVHSHSEFDLTFSLDDGHEEIRLALRPNHDILHHDFEVTYLDPEGNVRSVERVPRAEHKVYRGDAYVERPGEDGWSLAGWARITVHRDGRHPVFDGAFRVDGDDHHVHTGTKYNSLKLDDDPAFADWRGRDPDEIMVVWRDSDVRGSAGRGELKRDASGPPRCMSDSLNFNSQLNQELRRSPRLRGVDSRSLFGRQSIDGGSGGSGQDLIATIGDTSGCPTTKKVALVGIATDCTYWSGFNSSEDLRKNVIGIVNQASQVYENAFKISLGIRNLTVLDRGCPGAPSAATPWNVDCQSGTTISDRLNLFSAWRGRSLDGNAYWSLLTTCPTDSAVGLAWRSQVCRQGSGTSSDGRGNNETVAGANVVVRTTTEWQVFAHESGHTFGAVHDCTRSACPVDPSSQACCPLNASACDAGGGFIMNPSTGTGITQFSPCSVGNICSSLKAAALSSCLTDNKNVATITGSQCGNGIVEEGEQCDCGGEQGCQNNTCCDAKTCKFVNSAVCDPSNEDCCTSQCQFASSSTVCRPSTGECDIQETCPGNAAKCPDDQHKADGDTCGGGGGGGGLRCASGQCTSRDRQCQVAVGTSADNSSTGACPDTQDSCTVSCTSGQLAFGQRQCLLFGQNFIDGTPCGAGGHCSDGECTGSSTAREIRDWINGHKEIVIPIAVVVGLLLIAAVASGIISCCRRAQRRRGAPKTTSPPMAAWAQWGGGGQGRGAGRQTEMQYEMQYDPPPPGYDQQQQQQQQQQPPPPPQYGQLPDQQQWRPRIERYA
ncbi:disintegrin-like metalloprotease [Trichoderma cornu-damae]|uniref:Disintegrin and metalloproteinase domain-containing protein B n=1 Tax=Trichoderma cornu-damae TaxID=654480 RepID=A0A9P8U041_9HYPO|nr:disintegrin-like metalloprotease [Trichoderma cornu-damae]